MILPIVAAIVVVLIAIWWITTGNGLKQLLVKIKEADSDIEVALTKRFDTLTKMLDILKAYALHETETLTGIVKLRQGMSMLERSQASSDMKQLAGRLQLIAESYPQLRSSDNFKQLQISAADVEEHLQAARRLYNANVSNFNQKLVSFPDSLVAGCLKLKEHSFFDMDSSKKEDVSMKL